MKLNWDSSAEPQITADSKTQCYKWQWEGFPGFREESNMPSVLEIVPYVFACPSTFTYVGHSGSQDTWEETGRWLYGIFPQDSELPENIRNEIHELTDNCPDNLSKVRALYIWLGEHTRYVSIQLGIGGYSPMSPAKVTKNGLRLNIPSRMIMKWSSFPRLLNRRVPERFTQ